MAVEVHVGDVGTEFRIQMKDQDSEVVDVTPLTAILKIYLIKPNGEVIENNAIPGSTRNPELAGEDGWMHFITTEDIIDKSGKWKLEGYVEFAADQHWTSETTEFTVAKPRWIQTA